MAAEAGARVLLVGIDAGIVHMSIYAAYRDDISTPVLWQVERICDPATKYTWENVFRGALAFCDRHADVLAEASVVALESQMRDLYIVINAVIATRCSDRVVRVAPQTLCAAFRMPRKRAPKKAHTIKYVSARVKCDWPEGAPKLDDLADSCLMVFYLHDFYLPPVEYH